jgi:hypothetical protein
MPISGWFSPAINFQLFGFSEAEVGDREIPMDNGIVNEVLID